MDLFDDLERVTPINAAEFKHIRTMNYPTNKRGFIVKKMVCKILYIYMR